MKRYIITLSLSLLLFGSSAFGQRDRSGKPDRTDHYYNLTSLSLLGGSELSPSFQVINGYAFNPHWGLGLGLGIETFGGWNYFPLFIDGKYTLFEEGFSPFCSIGVGYDLATENFDRNKGGFLAMGRIGIQHPLGKHFGLVTSAGYRYAHLQQEVWNWGLGGQVLEVREINRFEFRFGFILR